MDGRGGGGGGGDPRGGGGGNAGGGDAGGSGGMRRMGLSSSMFELDPAAALGPLLAGPDVEHNQPMALLDALLEVGGPWGAGGGASLWSTLACF